MKNIKICMIDTLGLRFSGKSVRERGLGGSESATIYMSEELVKLGFDVIVYNKCEEQGGYNGVSYKDLNRIREDKETYDVIISLRSILPFVDQTLGVEIWNRFHKDIGIFEYIVPRAKKRIVWMHDTFLEGEEFLEPYLLSGKVNEVFTLSDWHSFYISQSEHWGTPKRRFEQMKRGIYQTRNGVNLYQDIDLDTKDENLFVYNSSVTKGMITLVQNVWPKVFEYNNNAKLKVIGGYYRGAGKNEEPDEGEKTWNKLKENYNGKMNIEFTGVISQKDIAEILTKATFLLYPPDFPETFGISTLEALCYGAIPITSNFGALEEIAIDKIAYKVEKQVLGKDSNSVDNFVNLIKTAYADKYGRKQRQQNCFAIREMVTWDKVAISWKYHICKMLGEYVTRQEVVEHRKATSSYNREFGRRLINTDDRFEYFPAVEEKKIVVITPVYNADKYIKKCIKSVDMQDYTNYTQIVVDDFSKDNTVKVIEKEVKENSKLNIIKNNDRIGALANQINVINKLDDETIVALLDGDDCLEFNPDIFKYINDIYQDDNIKMTYGSCYSEVDNIELIAQEYPEEVWLNKSFRTYNGFSWGIPYTHLRTFKASVLKNLDIEKLKDEDGNIFKAAGDAALMYAMLESLEKQNVKAVKRALVRYNDKNELNDYKVNSAEQKKNVDKIRNGKIIDGLGNIHEQVINRDDGAIKKYKDIISTRDDVWIDSLKGEHIYPRVQWLKEQLSKFRSKPDLILDVGSWTGAVANELYNFGHHDISCLDICEEVVKLGKTNFPNLTWINADIETYIPDKKYDIILMMEIVEHLVNPLDVLTKMKSYLNPNGKIFYTIPTEDCVMDNGRAREHISLITREDLESFNSEVKIIKANDGFSWYCGCISQNVDVRRKKIMIALPTRLYVEMETFASIYNLDAPADCDVDFQYSFGYNVAQVRNKLCDMAIQGNYDYIFWVDSDVVIPRNTLIQLLSHTENIVAGWYVQKTTDSDSPEVFLLNGNGTRRAYINEVKGKGLIDVGAVGFGCVLSKVSVVKDVGYPQFEYFNALDHKNTISEDSDFCKKARDKGYKIKVDTSLICEHIGRHIYIPQDNIK
jgi:glycosyltransferase involved in cell wall biosynthesis/GT2 family glycosyltransferase/ubiquinone/menaquinone biosynthesis C-methylase UbiE